MIKKRVKIGIYFILFWMTLMVLFAVKLFALGGFESLSKQLSETAAIVIAIILSLSLIVIMIKLIVSQIKLIKIEKNQNLKEAYEIENNDELLKTAKLEQRTSTFLLLISSLLISIIIFIFIDLIVSIALVGVLIYIYILSYVAKIIAYEKYGIDKNI